MDKRLSPNAEISFKMTGASAINERLRSTPDKLKKKGGNTALRKGAVVVRKAAIANAKMIDDERTKEAIYKNVYVQRAPKMAKAQGGVAFRVGILGGARKYSNTRVNQRKSRVGKTYKTGGDKGNPGGDTWYWRFVEFGTANNRAKPFLQRALADNTQRVTDVVVAGMNVELDKLFPKKASP